MRIVALAILFLLAGLLPGGEAPVPVVRDQLDGAPWYDRTADSWQRVDVPREDRPREHDDDDGFAMGGGTPAFAYVMYALVAVAIVLIVVQLWRLRGTGRGLGDATASRAAPVRLSALPFALPDAEGDPEAAFRAACAAGDWTRAVVWLYAWQLLRLDGAGVVRLLPGKTNRGYLREAAVLPAASGALVETVAVFERAYFGHQRATREEVERLRERHRVLLSALPTAEAAA